MLLEVAAVFFFPFRNGEPDRLQTGHGAAPPSPSPHVFALAPLALKQLALCRGGLAAVISVWQERSFFFLLFFFSFS